MNWQELSTRSLEETLAWAEGEPWVRAMAKCQQDAEWHSEGDVWTHTKLVCQQLPLLVEWPELTAHERLVLLYTALFHDSAKPLTSQSDPETGRITSPKHAVKGEQLARDVLRELEAPLAVREEIARMVRFHGRPVFLLERSDPTREVVTMSWLASNRLLYLFALADHRGRRTSDGRPEVNLHLWKLAAEEQGCFDRRYPFGNDQARVHYFRNEQADLHYVPHEKYRATVTMMSGLPGSGKDTWLAEHRPGLPVVSLDNIRRERDIEPTDNQGEILQAGQEECRALLRTGTSFAFNATNLLRQTRLRWSELFLDYGARLEMVYLEPSLATILAQNKHREHVVPERVILDLAGKCEPPTWGECHQLVLA